MQLFETKLSNLCILLNKTWYKYFILVIKLSVMMKIFPKLAMATLFFLMLSFVSFADQPPDPGGGPGGGDPPVGGGSPVGSGAIVLLALSIGYGTKKVLSLNKNLID